MATPKRAHPMYTTAAQQRYGMYFTDALRHNAFPKKNSIYLVTLRHY
jgi:hypothetical protein